ncbi:MAG: preprotein translocase subunit SecG [Lewinellaceae bacterium]|nr:preprotein translocase subunit SecG [Saprospiraceae bacterium]MCB9316170.1 preprotein translocase subunit SecG [Lewinellaceae bacterium]MCB9329592.1 preprotein translocase subunit SecG [Lewinellaceae bacterium]
MLPTLAVFIALVSILLMAAILVQNPKGGGIDPTFGGQAQQLFGAARSTDFIEKATWVLAAALLVLCIVAVLMVGTGGAATELPPLESAG